MSFYPEHQTLTANRINNIWIHVFDLSKSLTRNKREQSDLLEESFGQNEVEHRVSNSHCKWIASKCGSMGASDHPFSSLYCCETSTHRKAPTDTFG